MTSVGSGRMPGAGMGSATRSSTRRSFGASVRPASTGQRKYEAGQPDNRLAIDNPSVIGMPGLPPIPAFIAAPQQHAFTKVGCANEISNGWKRRVAPGDLAPVQRLRSPGTTRQGTHLFPCNHARWLVQPESLHILRKYDQNGSAHPAIGRKPAIDNVDMVSLLALRPHRGL